MSPIIPAIFLIRTTRLWKAERGRGRKEVKRFIVVAIALIELALNAYALTLDEAHVARSWKIKDNTRAFGVATVGLGFSMESGNATFRRRVKGLT